MTGGKRHGFSCRPVAVSYKTIHAWINRNFPRVGRCDFCATQTRTTYAVARRGHYTRNLADWLELCYSCHRAFDGPDSPETRRAKGERNRGRPKSAAHRAKMAAGKRAQWAVHPEWRERLARESRQRWRKAGTGALSAVVGLLVLCSTANAITWPDLSNNDPCICAAALKAHGHPGAIYKVNQGTGFIDSTFLGMAADAKRHGLAVGGYDFDQEYTAAEAYTFVNQLHRAGIYRSTPNTFPPTLDVEFGTPSRPGLEHQIAVLVREYGRVQIYTGAWYWYPHFGCWIPGHVWFWLSGYPRASILCGLSSANWVEHQYTDHGYNGSIYSDMSRWLKDSPSFQVFVTPPVTRHASRERSLAQHRKLRAQLHYLIEKHHCRPGDHARPRSYHTVCGRWLRRGNEVIAVIHRYEREGIR